MKHATSVVKSVYLRLIEHDLHMPFTISSGGMDSAQAVVVCVTLGDGTIGIGECAPFPAVSGETIESTVGALKSIVDGWISWRCAGSDVLVDGATLADRLPHAPAARCGFEMAVLDATLRSERRTLQDWLPPEVTSLTSDVTLPICSTAESLRFANDVVERGFTTLKVKIGSRSIEDEVALLAEIGKSFPSLALNLDANCAYVLATAIDLLVRLERADVRVGLLEQPLGRHELADMSALQRRTEIPVCLDESVASEADLDQILRYDNLRVINIKTMKMGLMPSVRILERAEAEDLGCMIGGMVESWLSMSVSAALAMRFARVVRYVDLDTPLFMVRGPIVGGMTFDGPTITLPSASLGHGCDLISDDRDNP